MRSAAFALSALASMALWACGSVAPRPLYAPPPFTADQLRDGFVRDRTYTFRQEGGRAPIRVMRLMSSTASGGLIWSQDEDGLGHPLGEPKVAEFTWAELESHATWNADITTVTEEPLRTPVGTHACLHYRVVTPVGTTDAWFDRTLPGPPIRYEERGTQAVFLMELIALKPGG